jgi:hypothetical protein
MDAQAGALDADMDQTVSHGSAAPRIVSMELPDVVVLGDPVAVDTVFTDVETPDSHDAVVDWGDGTSSFLVGVTPMVPFSATHAYAAGGIYVVTVTVTDSHGGADAVSRDVVATSRSGAAMGAALVTSPAGAYSPEPDLAGTAAIVFTVQHWYGSGAPIGRTSVAIQVGERRGWFWTNVHRATFQSTAYDWFVVTADGRAEFQGSGTLDGRGGYKIRVTAVDVRGADALRIVIWEEATGDVVYDNLPGADDGATATLLGGAVAVWAGIRRW